MTVQVSRADAWSAGSGSRRPGSAAARRACVAGLGDRDHDAGQGTAEDDVVDDVRQLVGGRVRGAQAVRLETVCAKTSWRAMAQQPRASTVSAAIRGGGPADARREGTARGARFRAVAAG